MAAAIEVRTDYTSADLRGFARRCGDVDQVRRLLAVAVILDGRRRSEAAKVAAVTLQSVRDRVLRFNEGGPRRPGDQERQIETLVEHYNHQRHHESLDDVTPADACFGRSDAIIKRRERIKRKTIEHQRLLHRKLAA